MAHRAAPAVVLLLTLLGALTGARENAPKLLVVLVVDQLRADYADSYGHQWTAGLRRLLDGGAWFRQAAYPYSATWTCSGHATIATGSFPAKHGMIQNSWWDRASDQRVGCTTDQRAEPISYGGPARERHSPHTLALPTLADVLRLKSAHRPRVVSVAIKPRSAITLAGQKADSVLWFDAEGTWATSTAYTDGPVTAVQQYFDANPFSRDIDAVWTRALPEDRYLYSDDDRAEQPRNAWGWGASFPHALGDDDAFARRWRVSPFSDGYLVEMALALVDAFELGRRDGTDYLALGFASLDLIGHRYGPRSHEVQDVLVRLDATVGSLLYGLDERVGSDSYVVALSSDHGVSPIPSQAAADGVDAGTIPTREILRQLEELLAQRLGSDPHVSAFENGNLYFKPGVYDRLRERPDLLEAVRDLIASAPGVWRVYKDDELQSGLGDDPLAEAARLSYYRRRSGDMVMIERPYWIGPSNPAAHGSPHPYDTRVPVILYGDGIKPGEYLAPITPADIAPTLAFMAGVTLPQPDGRVLVEALEP